MNTRFYTPLLLLAALAGAPSPAATIHPAPLRVPPGGPHPEHWFEHSTVLQHEELHRLSSSRSTQAQELAALLLAGDEDAYCDLAVRTDENKETVNALYSRASREQRAILAPLRAYHALSPARSSFRDLQQFGEPRSHVVLHLRDAFRLKGQQAKTDALRRLLREEPELNRVELTYIATALQQWCGITRDPLVEKRIVQSFILEYAQGLPVVVSLETQLNISYSYGYLYDFVLAEAGVNNERYFRLRTSTELMWRFLWRYPEQAVRMAEALDIPQLRLLRMDSESLATYADGLERRGLRLPPTLPPAPKAETAGGAAPHDILTHIRALLAEGKCSEAEQEVERMRDRPELDTTPACRTARSLLVEEAAPGLAARLRRDALLLALIRRDTEPEVFCAYVDDLLAHGTKDELALAQRISLWGKAMPNYARLAARYEALQCWAEAAFCHEALLALAPHRATPPTDEELAAHRQQLERCRTEAAGQTSAGAPAAPAWQPASPFRAESREWKLKDGTSVQGALAAVFPTLGHISLRLDDGSMREVPLAGLAESPDAYFTQWRADNGIRDWRWSDGLGCYQENLHGKLLATSADLEHPGDYHYTVVNENLSIARGQSWGLEPEARALVREHFRTQGSARPCGEPLVAASLAEAKQLAHETGLPVAYYFTSSRQGTSCSNEAMDTLETQLLLHPEEATQWRNSMIILPIYLSIAKGYPATYDDAELETLRSYERELRPGTTPEQSLVTEATKPERSQRSGPCWVCPARGIIHKGMLPPPLPKEPGSAAFGSVVQEL